MEKVYHWFLWVLGFSENEHITDMLRRQRERLGIWWYILVSLTIFGVIIGVGGGLIALAVHVLGGV